MIALPSFRAAQAHWLARLLVVMLLTSCATLKQIQGTRQVTADLAAGRADSALQTLDHAFTVKNSLYYLERGEVLGWFSPPRLVDSQQNLLKVDRQVDDWERQAQTAPERFAAHIGGYLLTEGMGSNYEPRDYEISLLSYRVALNHLLLGEWDNAEVAARKLAERETMIARSKEAALNDFKAKQKKEPKSRLDDIDGYPVEILNDPQVLALKNAWQSAAAHYLAGFIFESRGDTSLAAPGYRQAIELRPDLPLLRDALQRLETNIRRGNDGRCDTLFVIEDGHLPQVGIHKFFLNIPWANGGRIVSIALPVLAPRFNPVPPSALTISTGAESLNLSPVLVSDLDLMQRRWLHDAMPGYLLRAVSRAVASLAAQHAVDHAVSKSGSRNDNSQLAGALAGMLTGLALGSVDNPDVRQWTPLPRAIYLARAQLPQGANQIQLTSAQGAQNVAVQLKDRYAIVHLRLNGQLSIISTGQPGVAPTPSSAGVN